MRGMDGCRLAAWLCWARWARWAFEHRNIAQLRLGPGGPLPGVTGQTFGGLVVKQMC